MNSAPSAKWSLSGLSSVYIVGAVLTGGLSIAAISIFSRILTPNQLGTAFVYLSSVTITATVSYQWLKLSILKFRPEESTVSLYPEIRRGFRLSTIFAVFAGLGIAIWRGFHGDPLRYSIPILLSLILLHGAYRLRREWFRSELQAKHYLLFDFLKALTYISIGSGLALLGFGFYGILLAFGAGLLVPILLFPKTTGTHARSGTDLRSVARFGIPLSIAGLSAMIVRDIDRILLSVFLDDSAAGIYGASYDIVQGTILAVLAAISTASNPMVLNQSAQGYKKKVNKTLRQNSALILFLGIPSVSGLIFLRAPLASLLLGPGFRADAEILFPLIGLGAMLNGLLMYHVNFIYQLSDRTERLAKVMFSGVILNIGLNIWLIPIHGIPGAAVATLLTYLCMLAAGWILTRGIRDVPFARQTVVSVTLGTLAMYFVIQWIVPSDSLTRLILAILLAATTYLAVALFSEYLLSGPILDDLRS